MDSPLDSELLDAHHIPGVVGQPCDRFECPWNMTTVPPDGLSPIHDRQGLTSEPVSAWLDNHKPDDSEIRFYAELNGLTSGMAHPQCTVEVLANACAVITSAIRSWAKAEEFRWGRIEFNVDSDLITLLLDPTSGKRYISF